jgi:hypothetical protein
MWAIDISRIDNHFNISFINFNKYNIHHKAIQSQSQLKKIIIWSGVKTFQTQGCYRLLAVVLAHGSAITWLPKHFNHNPVPTDNAAHRCGLLAAIRASCGLLYFNQTPAVRQFMPPKLRTT